MSMTFMMQSVAGKSKKDAKITAHFSLDTRMLLDLVEAVNYRTDQPDDSSFDWIESGFDPEQGPSPRDCYSPTEVLSGLRWLHTLAKSRDKAVQAVWKGMWRQKEAFSPEAFVVVIGRDLDGLIAFCEAAQARKEKLIGGLV